MKTRLFLLFPIILFGLAACKNDDNLVNNPEGDDEPEVIMQEEPDYSSVIIDAPVFISSSIKAEVREGLHAFLNNVTTLEEAEVAMVKDEDIGTYDGELLALYQRGGFIVVAQPDGDRYREFAAKYDLPNVLPFSASQDVLLYATSNRREHYVGHRRARQGCCSAFRHQGWSSLYCPLAETFGSRDG